jgi:uroporphyrinogen decarboxylase
MLTDRENWLRAVEFRNPEWIPCSVGLSLLTWHTYREKLEAIVLRHPLLFKGYEKGRVDYDRFPPVYRQGEYFRDNWGCVWYNAIGGLEGMVVEHPLADWNALRTYRPPDPRTQSERGSRDWNAIKADLTKRKKKGFLTVGDGERLFDRLYFLRGFENLMMDIATDDPHLPELIGMLRDYEMKSISMWLELGVDAMGFHTDIGTQHGLMISPEKFRKYIKPLFKELFMTCRDAGARVCLSSDGDLRDIVDDLIECGVQVHDPQIRANTLDGIEKAYKGKMCINLDLDRQMFAFCTPQDIMDHVREAVKRLDSPQGGLMVTAQVYDHCTPLENVEAICAALETYCRVGGGCASG